MCSIADTPHKHSLIAPYTVQHQQPPPMPDFPPFRFLECEIDSCVRRGEYRPEDEQQQKHRPHADPRLKTEAKETSPPRMGGSPAK